MNERLNALLASRIQTLRFTCVFVIACAVAIVLIDRRDALDSPMRIANYLAVTGICLASLGFVKKYPTQAFHGFLVGIQLVVLVGLWVSGGIRRPLSFIEIPLLMLSSFLVGPRINWLLSGSFILSTIALVTCESNGWVRSTPTPETVHLFALTMSTVFGLYFVGKPLKLTQSLFIQGKAASEETRAHQDTLARSNEILKERLQTRERELTSVRMRLHQGTEGLSSSYEPTLQRIAVRAQFIREAMKDMDEARRYPVDRILAACDRLTRMHKAISRYSRLGPQGIQARHIGVEELGSTIRSVWDEIRQAYPRAEHRLFLSQLEGCHADPDMLRQVWQHLLSNAAKFSARENKPLIVVGCKEGEFHVKDNGVGFGADEARNLFELFGRQHSQDEFPGDGIGLASAKRIVELHGGDLRVVSQPGKGATFFFRLSGARREA